jgi:hypothetical protein
MNRIAEPVKMRFAILSLALACTIAKTSFGQDDLTRRLSFDFYGDSIRLPYDPVSFVDFTDSLSVDAIVAFSNKMKATGYEPMVTALLSYKQSLNMDDWLYYQLIRKTAQCISPKADNYHRYTLYKWFLLSHSGYDATLSIGGNRVLFYVQSDENIYNIPYRMRDGRQYVCLNYHDYGSIDFDKERFTEIALKPGGTPKAFSYKVTHLPHFNTAEYQEKDIRFSYNQQDIDLKVRLNPQVKTIFANYPVVDYESYFNIPLSRETYSSLIPLLKKNVAGMKVKEGVDFLMRFTRYAFLFQPDTKTFGNEKRLSPEQTLLYEQSDCEDRAALFFYLVKEIYNLPMIVLSYPKHVTVGVQFEKPFGNTITYNGKQYSICEPTPQRRDLRIGELLPELRKTSYEIAYAYEPNH